MKNDMASILYEVARGKASRQQKSVFFVWYDQKKIGLMDLPHLMDNAARCPQALGQAVLATTPQAPTAMKIYL